MMLTHIPGNQAAGLAMSGYMSSVDRLVRDLSHSQPSVRLAAAQTLRSLPGQQVTAALLAALGGGEAGAAQVLGWRGDPLAVPGLVAALSSAQMGVHQNARAALVALRAVEALRQAFRQGTLPQCRQLALRALLELKPEDLDQLLSEALEDASAEVRSLAEHHGGVPRRTNSPDPAVRLSAVRALAWRQVATDEEALRLALTDDEPDIRATALEGLGRIWRGLDPALIHALADPSRDVRAAACRALGEIGLGWEQLLAALQDGDDMVRSEAAQALGRLRVAAALDGLIVELGRGSWAAARALGQIGDARALEPLLEALAGPVDDIAAEALGLLGDRRAIPALQAYMERWRPRPGWRADDGPSGADQARAALARLQKD